MGLGLHRLWGGGRGSPGSGSPCGACGSGRRRRPRVGTRSARRSGSDTRPGTARGRCTAPRSCGWAPDLKQREGQRSTLCACPGAGDAPHPPSPGPGFPYRHGAACGRSSQGSPIPVQAGASWTCKGFTHPCPSKRSSAPSSCHAVHLTLTHLGSHQGLLRRPEAQLPAHHAGCGQVPLLVTHSAPLPVAQHLHPAFADMGARSQPHQEHLGRGSSQSAAPGQGHHGSRTLHQQDGAWGHAGTHLSWGGLAPALAGALLEGRAGEAADNGVHATGAGILAGGWWGHLCGAAGQVGLCAPALHPVDPEAVLLAEGLQTAKVEEQEQASARVLETVPHPTPALGVHTGCPCPGLNPTWIWGPSASCSRASCGCTEPGGQGGP